jgi:hypothetical protein
MAPSAALQFDLSKLALKIVTIWLGATPNPRCEPPGRTRSHSRFYAPIPFCCPSRSGPGEETKRPSTPALPQAPPDAGHRGPDDHRYVVGGEDGVGRLPAGATSSYEGSLVGDVSGLRLSWFGHASRNICRRKNRRSFRFQSPAGGSANPQTLSLPCAPVHTLVPPPISPGKGRRGCRPTVVSPFGIDFGHPGTGFGQISY